MARTSAWCEPQLHLTVVISRCELVRMHIRFTYSTHTCTDIIHTHEQMQYTHIQYTYMNRCNTHTYNTHTCTDIIYTHIRTSYAHMSRYIHTCSHTPLFFGATVRPLWYGPRLVLTVVKSRRGLVQSMHVYMYMCASVYACIYAHTHTYIQSDCVCMYIYIYIYTYIYIYVCVDQYTF